MRLCLMLVCTMLLSLAWADMLAPGTGLRASFYANAELTGKALTQSRAVADLAWTADAPPAPGLSVGVFGAKWQGYLLPATSENYTFTLTATGGVRLLVDEKCIIDDMKAHPVKIDTGVIALQAGKLTTILLRTTQPAGAGMLKLQWSSPGHALEVIPAARLYPPLFSPMMLIYAESADPHTSILYATTFDGPAKKLTVAGCSQPVFSPDGKTVFFRTEANAAFDSSGILRITSDGKKQNQLTRPGGERYDPCLSGDGSTIAYAEKTTEAWEIWTMRVDGAKRKCVVHDDYENRHPALAADGSFIVYQSLREGKWNLFRVQADGSDEKQLTTLDGSEPVINHQGDMLAFISSRSGRAQVYVMSPAGGLQMILAATPGIDSQPFFLRSGKQLGYIERTPKGKSDVFLLDLAEGAPYQLTASGKCFAAALTDVLHMPCSDNLVFWLNALQTSSLSFDEQSRVSAWTDASPHGYLAVQTNVAEQPSYHATGLNERPTVYFAGSNRMLAPDISPGWNGNEGTVVALFVPDNTAQFTVLHQDNGGHSEYWRYSGNGDAYIGFFINGRQENYPPQVPDHGIVMLTIVSGAQYTAYLNGTAALPAHNSQFLAPTTLTIGTGGDAGFFKGDLAEVAIFNRALTDDERLMVENYFRSLYGLL